MSTNLPGALDVFTDPTPTSLMTSPSHSGLHTNINDAVLAIEKIIIGPLVFNVRGYGATGNGTTDDTTAIQAAITAAEVSGGVVEFPAGNYLISSTLTITTPNVALRGVNDWTSWVGTPGGAVIKVASGTSSPLITISASNIGVQGLSFTTVSGTAPATPITVSGSSGSQINNISLRRLYATNLGGLSATYMNRFVVEDVVFQSWYGAAGFALSNCSIGFINRCNAAVSSSGLGPNFSLTSCTSINFGPCESNGIPTYGLYALNSNDCETLDFESNGGAVAHVYHQGCTDWEHHRLYTQSNLAPTALDLVDSGIIAIVGGWIGNGGTYTLRMRSVSGTTQDVRVVGALIDGSNSTGGNPPVSIETHSTRITVAGCSIIAESGVATGIADTSTLSNHRASYTGNTFFNTTDATAITVATPGKYVTTSGNAGFQPGGQTAPSVPASTTALTNPFPFDCTVYVAGGTVSAIAVGGTVTGMTSGPIRVPAGQTITLTYSAAPTWVWVGNQ